MQRGYLHEATRIMPSQVCYRATQCFGPRTFANKAIQQIIRRVESIDVNWT